MNSGITENERKKMDQTMEDIESGKIKPIGVIDCEPKWTNLVPQFVDWIEHGNEDQHKIAVEYIEQMAVACDGIRQYQKGKSGLTCPVCGSEKAMVDKKTG